MKGNPARPGGSLTSKPTWQGTSGCPATSAFFSLPMVRHGPDRAFATPSFVTREGYNG